MNLRQFYVGRAIGFLALVVLAGIVAGFFWLNDSLYEKKHAPAAATHQNAQYRIGGQNVQLVDGVSTMEAAPGSASEIVTRYFGNELKTDLNADGREDVVFLMTQTTGGSGVFYYVVAALNTDRGFVGSEGLLLGDRIAPQTTEVSQNPNHRGVIVVNYADRELGQPFTTAPSVGKSIALKLDVSSMQWGEVAQNFEGEADPSRMSLTMKRWDWVSATVGGAQIVPKSSGKFFLTFNTDGRVAVSTDCNSMSGSYTAGTNTLSFGEMAMTRMYCEGSQEMEMAAILEATQGYHFTSRGELMLVLAGGGSATFR